MAVPDDPIAWCLAGFICFEVAVCAFALRRVSDLADSMMKEQRIATDLVRKFVALRSEVMNDKFATYEIKDAVKSFTLKASDLRATRKRAAQQGKQSVWIIRFPGFILECRIRPDTVEYENGED